jgi:hypothetical protein
VRRFLLILVILGAGWLVGRGGLVPGLPALGLGGAGTRTQGRQVVRDAGQLEAEFHRVGSLDDRYMLFGGTATRQANSITHAVVAGLPIRWAREIAASYPDFHLCRSPGAAQAKRLTEHLSFVAADGAARDTLEEALDLFQTRLRGDGDRTCIHVQGAPLALDAVRVEETGEDITGQLPPAFTDVDYVLAERVEIQDCAPLLR